MTQTQWCYGHVKQIEQWKMVAIKKALYIRINTHHHGLLKCSYWAIKIHK